jgi:hypothetical protein
MGNGVGHVAGQLRCAAWVLTASHLFDDHTPARHYRYRSGGGTVRRGVRRILHPLYNGDVEERCGYDVALVRLDGPIGDAGPVPLLHGGNVPGGTPIVIVGFGNRGTTAQGERDTEKYNSRHNKTAAENVTDGQMLPAASVPKRGDAGNWLQVTMRREAQGASPLERILGSGDSGGSLWMRRNERWSVVGVNVSGTGESYGARSYFVRLAGVRDWLTSVLPGLQFVD